MTSLRADHFLAALALLGSQPDGPSPALVRRLLLARGRVGLGAALDELHEGAFATEGARVASAARRDWSAAVVELITTAGPAVIERALLLVDSVDPDAGPDCESCQIPAGATLDPAGIATGWVCRICGSCSIGGRPAAGPLSLRADGTSIVVGLDGVDGAGPLTVALEVRDGSSKAVVASEVTTVEPSLGGVELTVECDPPLGADLHTIRLLAVADLDIAWRHGRIAIHEDEDP